MRYIIRRIATLVITVILVSLVTFTAFSVIPGDPVELILGTDASPQQIAMVRKDLGLDQSLPMRYVNWISGFATGNLGNSIKFSVPVKSLVEDRLPVTIWLSILSILMTVIVSVPISVYSAKKHGTIIDKVINAMTMLSMSIPSFFLGLILILFFGILISVFTPGAYVDYKQNFGGFLKYLIFPAISIALPKIAAVVKFLRNSLIEQLQADYVRTAFSKGNRDNAVLYGHVLKNALIPVITLLGMITTEVLAGSIIIEQVFGLPGIGRLIISSVMFRDFPLIETIVVVVALIMIVVNFLVDIMYQIIDPRIRVK